MAILAMKETRAGRPCHVVGASGAGRLYIAAPHLRSTQGRFPIGSGQVASRGHY